MMQLKNLTSDTSLLDKLSQKEMKALAQKIKKSISKGSEKPLTKSVRAKK